MPENVRIMEPGKLALFEHALEKRLILLIKLLALHGCQLVDSLVKQLQEVDAKI